VSFRASNGPARGSQDERLCIVLRTALQIFHDEWQKMRTAHVDVLRLCCDVQVKLKDTWHVMEEHLEAFCLPGVEPHSSDVVSVTKVLKLHILERK
jgi:hypothetical protein